MPSIGAGYLQDVAGIPSAYTNLLEQLGYMNTPFQNVDQGFGSIENFQRSLKHILDQQGQAWGSTFTDDPGKGFTYMPMNLRNIYSSAAPIMTDPMYGIIGAPGMFSGGYKMGDLPGGHSAAYQLLLDQRNAPRINPPNIGGGGGGGGSGAQYTDSGTHQGLDEYGREYTIPKGYGSMTEKEKDDANRFGRQYPSGHASSTSNAMSNIGNNGGNRQAAYVPPPVVTNAGGQFAQSGISEGTRRGGSTAISTGSSGGSGIAEGTSRNRQRQY